MFLLDESLFRLWRDGLVDKEDVLGRTSKPAELAGKIAAYEKGILSDEEELDEDEEETEDQEDQEDEDYEDEPQVRRRQPPQQRRRE
jgi:twitching motility protein PilT